MQIPLTESGGENVVQYMSFNYLPSQNSYSYTNNTYYYNGNSCLSVSAPSAGTWYYAIGTSYGGQSFKTQLELNGDGSCSFQTSKKLIPLKQISI